MSSLSRGSSAAVLRVEPPSATGFGTKLIKVALDGMPRISYGPGGFEYEVVIPTEHLKP